MVAPSSLSIVCEHIRQFVRTEIDAAANGLEVSIGAPAAIDTGSEHHLNLFFYRFEPSGFEAGARPDAPWRIRMFCLVTPFGINEGTGSATVPAGENDMRMLGDVMRVFHETPILPPVAAGGVTVRTQVMFLSTTDEQINQVWSTQGDIHYRPSVVYEMSLTPIVPAALAPPPRIVGTIGLEARTTADRHAPFAGVAAGPPVRRQVVDTSDPAWVPALAWVVGDTLHRSLALDVDDPGFADPAVWLAGDPAADVTLVWQAWRSSGWEATGAEIDAHPQGPAIDPDAIPPVGAGFPLPTPLPEELPAGAASQQLLLFAQRDVTRLDGSIERLRSEPLLVTLWRSP
jgi:hypothetical protein